MEAIILNSNNVFKKQNNKLKRIAVGRYSYFPYSGAQGHYQTMQSNILLPHLKDRLAQWFRAWVLDPDGWVCILSL